MARLLILSFSDHARDPRVHRQLEALREGHEVVAAGFGPPLAAAVRFIDLRPGPSRTRERVSEAAGLTRMLARRFERAYWGNRTVRHALARLEPERFDAIVSNDVHTLPLALRLARGGPVVFDAHEYYPEHFAQDRWWRATLAPHFRHLCAVHMPRATSAMTPSPGLAARYREELGVDPTVVLNTPERAALEPGPVGDPIRLLHHGVADRRRGLDRTIEAVRLLDERFRLDLVLLDGGRGELERLRGLAAGDPRIRFLPPVAMPKLPRFANAYDVGVFLLEPHSFNQRHVLPNKLFEFIQGRLAVAIGPSPDMADVVRRHACGVVARDFSASALADALRALSRERIAELQRGSHAAAEVLHAGTAREQIRRQVEAALAGAAGGTGRASEQPAAAGVDPPADEP